MGINVLLLAIAFHYYALVSGTRKLPLDNKGLSGKFVLTSFYVQTCPTTIENRHELSGQPFTDESIILSAFMEIQNVTGELRADVDFCEPVFSAIGRHYTPRAECVRSDEKSKVRQYEFQKKYLKELGNDEETVAILNELCYADSKLFETPDIRCSACTAGVKLIRYMIESNYTDEEILKLTENMCVDLNILYPEMCKGFIKVYGDAACKIMRTSSHDPETFCSIMFNGYCYPEAADKIKWNVQLPQKPKPPLLKLRENPGKPKLKILQISDTHWDVKYSENSASECRAPLCCRNGSVPISNNSATSGKWGGWKCDIPEATFDSVLNHINEQHKDIDYIVWTGDIPAHDLWDQDVEKNYKILDLTVKKIKKAFPNVPIYPALGNHESIPPNLFPAKNQTPDDPLEWLYFKLNQEWKNWLPGNNSNTILRGGFYSVLVRPKLRLISMNMNYCYSMNWWLLVDHVDPEKELKWLVEELAKAEEKGEKVHIIGHIPPGYKECIKGWQTNFYNIINRFENTVTAQIYGHTHFDEVEIFYDMKDQKRAFGVAYVGPSVTTYTYLNPGYKIYYVDGDYEGSTRYVLDHETWIMDLEKSNKDLLDHWILFYKAKDTYNMNSLFPSDWDTTYKTMKSDNKLLQMYYNLYWKNSPKKPAFNEKYRQEILCDIRSCIQYGK